MATCAGFLLYSPSGCSSSLLSINLYILTGVNTFAAMLMKKSILLFLLFIGSVAVHAQKLVLATYQYADNNRLKNIQPLADHIAKETGLEVQVKSYPSVHLFIEAIQANEVDIALINTFGYFLLDASSKKYNMKPLVVLKVRDDAKDNYKTAFVSLKQLAVDTITALKQVAATSSLALVDPGSTSGNLVPRLALNAAGIRNPEKDFLAFSYGKNHRATLDLVLQGKASVAAVGSTEYFNMLKDTAKSNRVKLLWLSPEIPLGPVLVHNRLNRQIKDRLRAMLLDLHLSNQPALEWVKQGWSEAKQAEKYVPVTKSFYTPFKQQLGETKTMEMILKQFAN